MITLAALAAGCGVFLFATWDRGDARDRKSQTADEPARQGAPFEPARRTEPPLLSDDIDPYALPLIDEGDPLPAIERPQDTTGAAPSGVSAAEQRRVLAESARRAPLLAYSRSGRASTGADHATPLPVTAPQSPTSLDELRRLSPIGQAQAGRLPDRNLLITAGTNLPCVLQTAMDSATPGYVSCLVSRDVFSDNGAVVLMERGTRVLGEYRGGLEAGRRRLFVLWTRAVTPTGVAVALASPATDALGQSGFDGEIDTRFWDRFGGTLLLSIVDDGVYAAAGRGQEFQSSARVPSDAAAVALQNSVAIPPTLRKAQGAEVSIFVAQDLNFAGVYRLRPR
ncbi:type IV secretion system protein VirB10 [Brevundimonas sp. MYb46]|nr:type IV secretion system protein VirB10 [Brevundimonas sp. MYb31]PRA27674.1 type IV secretion system protein VirB10 [Brevundimonas sp. MYb27]PRB18076.1 type IV secretion system protein VirB10 [Brevundimonas sp. MYb52]PRB38322.1 type IV secretion system protein VirB10 [Brevundimonas sp. MYb46]PRB45402.1 type IV secretion system protein VirB10 [Brevundimonas sp. MYb33]